jgi:hypothetical protein
MVALDPFTVRHQLFGLPTDLYRKVDIINSFKSRNHLILN